MLPVYIIILLILSNILHNTVFTNTLLIHWHTHAQSKQQILKFDNSRIIKKLLKHWYAYRCSKSLCHPP